MEFIRVTELKNIFKRSEVIEQPKKLLEYFITHNEEVVYICEGDCIEGLISPGDILRYYQNRKSEFYPNIKYTYLESIDIDRAKEIMDRFITINEIPIVNDKKLIGIIRRKKKRTEEEWKQYKINLINLYEALPLINALKKLKSHKSAGELYLYTNPEHNFYSWLSVEQRTEYEKKIVYTQSSDYNIEEEAKREGFCLEHRNMGGYIHKNGFYFSKDFASKNLNIKNGYRITPNAKKNSYKIFIFGPCTAFGGYVDDYNTIEYFLQRKINEYNLPYEVVNCGTMGPKISYNRIFCERMNSKDKIIVFLRDWREIISSVFKENYKGNLTTVFQKMEDPINCWLNAPSHCNGYANEKMAEFIWEDLKENLDKTINLKEKIERESVLDYYISYDIYNYFDEYLKKNNLKYNFTRNGEIGSIVMNCNPFTYGHRYLIERACEKVEQLYVFVVEEDKSYFSFEDRYEMVKGNTADLSKVIVIPSGKYIISKDTFAQYFEKEVVTEVNSMDYDVRIFGEVLAEKLGIKYRFVGEEPFDIVTKEYNETMKRILPEYGIQVEEIPRLKSEDEDVISATKVRELYKQEDYKELEKYCPEYTIKYLKKIHHKN